MKNGNPAPGARPIAGAATTVSAWWRSLVAKHAERELVRKNGSGFLYRDIDERSAALARGLLADGAGKGTRIGMLIPNGPDWIVAWLAIERIGAIAVTISTFFAARELAYAVRHADVAILLTADSYLRHDYCARLEEAFAGLAARDGSQPLILEECPYLRSIWVAGKAHPKWSRGSLAALEDRGRASAVYSPALLKATEAAVSPADLGMLIYTSGSTSEPKAVMHKQGPVIDKISFLVGAIALIPSYTDPGDRCVVAAPFFWVGGFLILTGAMEIGATVICVDEPSPEVLLETARAEKATHVTGSDAVLRSLQNSPHCRPGDLERLKPLTSSQAPFFRGDAPLDLVPNSLGMTETMGPHSGQPGGGLLPPTAKNSMGQVLSDMEFKIADPDTGEALPAGTSGELCVRGPWLMDGFYKRQRWTVFDADGFYHTGDRCVLDAEGYLFFHGRLGGMIKTAGANVSPEEVEEVIRLHEDVLDVAVFGVPDPKLEQMVVAVVAARQQSSLDEAALKASLRTQLSSFKVPKRILFRDYDSLPRTPSNKIRKPALAQMVAPVLAEEKASQG